MATKPVKVLTDLLTKKQIIKRDFNDNLLFNVSGTLNNGHVSSSLPLTASSGYIPDFFISSKTSFDNIPVITGSNGEYNVDNTFHLLDKIAGANKRLKYQLVGNFDFEGNAEIKLPKQQYGGKAFPASSIDYVNVSVMIKDGSTWTNDLISINIMVTGSLEDEVGVQISAPALNETNKFRLLATNENPEDYIN